MSAAAVTLTRSTARLESQPSVHRPSGIIDIRSELRAQAAQADSASSIEISLALLWRELSRGLCTVNDAFFTERRCFLCTTAVTEPRRPMPRKRRDILEKVLMGVGQKNIAIELGIAPSTVALNAKQGLDTFGMSCRASRAHPLVMLAAWAERNGNTRVSGTLSFVDRGGQEVRIIAVPRPDLRLGSVLPPAELSVVRALIEGESYEDIAERRGTSVRTIANQITAVFRRMRLSGRSELLLRLFASSLVLGPQ